MVELFAKDIPIATALPPLDLQELQVMLQHLPGGVVIAEAPSGKLIYENAYALDGLRHPLAYGGRYQRYCHGAVHPDGRRYRTDEYPIARALLGEVVSAEKMLFRSDDGSLRPVLVSAVPIAAADGSVGKVLSTFVQLADRNPADDGQQEREQRLYRAVQGADLALWTIDIASGAASFDHRLHSLLGYAPGQIDASFNAWLSLVHADDKQPLLDQWHDHLESKIPLLEIAARYRTVEGQWKWLLLRGQVVERGPGGQAQLAAGVVIDIDQARQAEMSLHEREARLRATLEQAAIGIATVAPSGHWLSVNPKIGAILGYPEAELLQDGNVRQVTHGADLPHFDQLWEAVLHNEIRSFSQELRMVRKDGTEIWVDCTVSPVCDELGRVQYLAQVMQDTTARKLAEQQMRKMQKQLTIAARIAQLGFWEWSPVSGDIYFSPEWKAQLGYRDDELQNRWDEWEGRIHADDLPGVLARIDAFLAAPGSEFVDEFRMRHKDHSYRWISVRGVPMFDSDGRLAKLVGIHLDITEQKQAQESIRHLAQHDGLTGLPNRSLLYEFSEHLLATARRSGAPLAVLFVDLDRFKAVNDTHGHKVGDRVLQEVARRLGRTVRAEDVICRLGGDEFVAVLPSIGSRQGAATVAAKALAALGQPYLIDQIVLQLSPSIGISMFPDDGDQVDGLIQKADEAMYQVKRNGRNHYRFHAAPHSLATQEQQAMESRLRAALEHGEFLLYYQPMLDTRSGAVTGVEALLRWPQQDHTAIDPGTFLPAAEACGLMRPLGEWVLQEACRQHQQWRQQGLPPIAIAVNMSAAQLQQQDLERDIDAALSATRTDPAWLEIALTEGALMKNFDSVAAVLQALKRNGLKIALEDVGCGVTNIAQLSRLPLDKLKLDQSCLRHLGSDRSSLAVADMIIALGRSLGIDVVAEGIESEKDLQWWQQHDCQQGQGFHLGRPMPGKQFALWYRQHAATRH